MEPFYTTKGVGKGTGLGLSMVHGMAQQSDGSFVLKSKVGEGTTAELRLPLALATPAAEPVPIAQATEAPSVEAPSLTIVAVDDDVLVLTNTVAMLEDLGHTAIGAASGEEALRVLHQQDKVDLVITDQAMPYMTGAELADVIHAERPGLPVILATGFAELEPDVSADLPRLAKPFSELDLGREIARMFPPQRDSGGNVVRFRWNSAKQGG
jgi:CheY-like chemotaxis protein